MRPDEIISDDELYVSIHAPAWGATRPISLTNRYTGVSIHAPAWGATAAYRELQVP